MHDRSMCSVGEFAIKILLTGSICGPSLWSWDERMGFYWKWYLPPWTRICTEITCVNIGMSSLR